MLGAECEAAHQALSNIETSIKEANEAIHILHEVLGRNHMIATKYFFGPQLLEACKREGLSFDHKLLESGQFLLGGPHVVYAYTALKVKWP